MPENRKKRKAAEKKKNNSDSKKMRSGDKRAGALKTVLAEAKEKLKVIHPAFHICDTCILSLYQVDQNKLGSVIILMKRWRMTILEDTYEEMAKLFQKLDSLYLLPLDDRMTAETWAGNIIEWKRWQ